MVRTFALAALVLTGLSCRGPQPDLTLGLTPENLARFVTDDIVLLETPSPFASSIEEELAGPHMRGTAFRIHTNVFVTARHVLDHGEFV